MKRRQMLAMPVAALAMQNAGGQNAGNAAGEQAIPEKLLLKDYRPRSIYRTPKTEITRAKFPIVDVHCHGARPIEELDEMVKLMDKVGVERTVIFTGASTEERFAEVRMPYAKYGNRFSLWCSFDMRGNDQPGFGPEAVKALEACHRLGAAGVGEISDKGRGFASFSGRGGGGKKGGGPNAGGAAAPRPNGPHPDDARMDSLFARCGQLGMPVNVHVSDPIWSYQPMDEHNDGLMNGYTWRIDEKQPGLLGHNGLIESLEKAVQKHRKTVFIACHLANLDYDLTRLGQMFDRNPNLYVDISARFAELAPIPRFVNQFFQKHSDRILYATDMAYTQAMFSTTFRILESQDEHFYENDLNFNFNYHWPLNGFGLPDGVLKKVYRENALRAFAQAKKNAG